MFDFLKTAVGGGRIAELAMWEVIVRVTDEIKSNMPECERRWTEDTATGREPFNQNSL